MAIRGGSRVRSLMNVNVLIDSIVRQTTVLIAQLATTAGVRAPLAHVANQVFLDLVKELKEQGLGNKVIADMFGMALRTYHSRVRRLSESSTYGGRSLWEAMLEYIQDKQTVLRADVLQRFRGDDPATVRSVLKDLVDTGMVFQSGRGDRTTYRAATAEEVTLSQTADEAEGIAHMVWVAVNRFAPASEQEILQAVPLEPEQLRRALDSLLADGRIAETLRDGAAVYACDCCVIPLGSSLGWEAAVFDHYQGMVTALCTKLRRGSLQSSKGEAIGGSTYGYDVWPGHPHYDEVLGFLSEVRAHAVQLRQKVEAYNDVNPPNESSSRVITYVGQTVLGQEEEVEP